MAANTYAAVLRGIPDLLVIYLATSVEVRS